MDDLTSFIRSRLAEDESVALACDQKIWHAGSAWASDLINPLPSQRRDHPGYIPMITQADLDHIARHDPARVLREVEAKRRITAIHRRRADVNEHESGIGRFDECCDGCGYGGLCDDPNVEHVDECPELRALASVWSDHPDYRAEWRDGRS